MAPYKAWAQRNPLAYEEVVAGGAAWAGKAVVWEISRHADDCFFWQGDPAKKISWFEPAGDELKAVFPDGKPVRALLRIENFEEPPPVLTLLEVL
jgi:hypothetical protein